MGCTSSAVARGASVRAAPLTFAHDRVPSEHEVYEAKRRYARRAGGIPPADRATAWVLLLRAREMQAAFPGLYRHALGHCTQAKEVARVILVDVPRTLWFVPALAPGPLDEPDGPGGLTLAFNPPGTLTPRQQLARILLAYASIDDTVRYCQGMACAAAMLLLAGIPEELAFYCFLSLMSRFGLRALFCSGFPALAPFSSALDALLRRRMPKLSAKLRDAGVGLDMFVTPWLLSSFVSSPLPVSSAMLIMDAVVCTHDPDAMPRGKPGLSFKDSGSGGGKAGAAGTPPHKPYQQHHRHLHHHSLVHQAHAQPRAAAPRPASTGGVPAPPGNSGGGAAGAGGGAHTLLVPDLPMCAVTDAVRLPEAYATAILLLLRCMRKRIMRAHGFEGVFAAVRAREMEVAVRVAVPDGEEPPPPPPPVEPAPSLPHQPSSSISDDTPVVPLTQVPQPPCGPPPPPARRLSTSSDHSSGTSVGRGAGLRGAALPPVVLGPGVTAAQGLGGGDSDDDDDDADDPVAALVFRASGGAGVDRTGEPVTPVLRTLSGTVMDPKGDERRTRRLSSGIAVAPADTTGALAPAVVLASRERRPSISASPPPTPVATPVATPAPAPAPAPPPNGRHATDLRRGSLDLVVAARALPRAVVAFHIADDTGELRMTRTPVVGFGAGSPSKPSAATRAHRSGAPRPRPARQRRGSGGPGVGESKRYPGLEEGSGTGLVVPDVAHTGHVRAAVSVAADSYDGYLRTGLPVHFRTINSTSSDGVRLVDGKALAAAPETHPVKFGRLLRQRRLVVTSAELLGAVQDALEEMRSHAQVVP